MIPMDSMTVHVLRQTENDALFIQWFDMDTNRKRAFCRIVEHGGAKRHIVEMADCTIDIRRDGDPVAATYTVRAYRHGYSHGLNLPVHYLETA